MPEAQFLEGKIDIRITSVSGNTVRTVACVPLSVRMQVCGPGVVFSIHCCKLSELAAAVVTIIGTIIIINNNY